MCFKCKILISCICFKIVQFSIKKKKIIIIIDWLSDPSYFHTHIKTHTKKEKFSGYKQVLLELFLNILNL